MKKKSTNKQNKKKELTSSIKRIIKRDDQIGFQFSQKREDPKYQEDLENKEEQQYQYTDNMISQFKIKDIQQNSGLYLIVQKVHLKPVIFPQVDQMIVVNPLHQKVVTVKTVQFKARVT
ncbi:unnamed protein product (macronuclear) [Paramecium tetraurelia]|uniref:Uncharacterized protein n=1 Tax=Paramecium tetraurelia TaxID=5888 RepID=A0C518_PARTE|nr:uncharacterized protein GSPATT00006384001 [Paramecium tetraurelia]CAK65885.1 unnamed protein product [Paramecium tetraurelia]|eukprot:XP_001433282.1 hypothetical protein (macronuclear) [Paramecium tetraurelia strain d4-2]